MRKKIMEAKKNIYRQIFKQAWDVVKNNKLLWFFGLFAALLGNGGEYQVLLKLLNDIKIGEEMHFIRPMAAMAQGNFRGVINFLSYNPLEFALVLMTAFAILFFIGFFLWLAIVSQISLIEGANKILARKKINYNDSVDSGIKKFAPVLGLNIVAKFLVLCIVFGFGLPLLFLVARSSSLFNNILYVLIFLILVSFGIIISFIAKYSIAYVVLKKENFIDSIKLAVNLFLHNWIVSLEMALMLFLINIIAGLAVVSIIILVSLPLATITFIYFLSGFFVGAWFIIILMAIINLIIIGFVGAILSAFQWTSWVALFKKLTSKETILSKIDRTVRAFPEWIKARIKNKTP